MRKILYIAFAMMLLMAGCTTQTNQQPTDQPTATPALTTVPTAEPTVQPTAQPDATSEAAAQPADLLDAYKDMVISEDDSTVTVLDARGNEVILKKNPHRVISLQNTALDLWYMAGGEAVARVSGTTNVPDAAMDLPEVGKTTAPNTELLLAAQPDLVILNATSESHVKLEPILNENNIAYFYSGTSVNCYESMMRTLYVFSRLTGSTDAYAGNVVAIDQQCKAICQSVADQEAPSVLVLFGSSSYVKCEVDTGLVGEMCKMLGAQNVVENTAPEGETKVDFSLEAIVAADPDFILVSMMGDEDEIKARMVSDIESNEAWSSLTAVQEGRVYYLPSDLYMYKPNARYPEALQGLADILYGE